MSTARHEQQANFFGTKLTFSHFLTKRVILIGLGLLGLGLALRLPSLLARDAVTTETAVERILPVETMTAELVATYHVPHAYTGLIAARRASPLSFELPGTLVQLTVDEGERVTAGATLGRLDRRSLVARQRELQAQHAGARARLNELVAGPRLETIAAARAQVHELQETLTLAELRQTRRQALLRKGVIARETFDEADVQTKTVLARLDAAQRQLDELVAGTRPEQIQAQKALLAQIDARLTAIALDLEKSVLQAPFDGTIAVRHVDEGTVVAPGQPIVRLVEDTHLEARVGLPPHIAPTVPIGSTQRIQIGADTHPATVTALLPELTASTRTVTAVLQLETLNTRHARLGQVARLLLNETVEASGYWLPTTALTKGDRGLWSCYALIPAAGATPQHYRVERRDVEVLHTENSRVFVRGLLQPGEYIVKNGTHRLVAGQLVQPVRQF